MKNESLKYPFPMLGDEMFDTNKDGKLDITETMFRDMYIDEMKRKEEESCDEQDNFPKMKSSFGSGNILADILVVIALLPVIILGACFLLLSFTDDRR